MYLYPVLDVHSKHKKSSGLSYPWCTSNISIIICRGNNPFSFISFWLAWEDTLILISVKCVPPWKMILYPGCSNSNGIYLYFFLFPLPQWAEQKEGGKCYFFSSFFRFRFFFIFVRPCNITWTEKWTLQSLPSTAVYLNWNKYLNSKFKS